VKAGAYMRLFHRENEGFISTRFNDLDFRFNSEANFSPLDGIFDHFLKEADIEQRHSVHLRLSNILRKSKSTHSSLSIFQIEHEKPNDGSIIKWNQPVRFRHGIIQFKFYFFSFKWIVSCD
jgi:hypothetical protein